MTERRKHKRMPRRLRVLYGNQDLKKVGFTKDVSTGGMYILCNGPLPSGTQLHLQVFLNDQEFLLLEGVPIHAKEVPPALRAATTQGFGVRFLLPGEALSKVVQAQAGGTYLIEYETVAQLQAAWARELQHGGVFVETPQPAERDIAVNIQLRLSFADVGIEVRGRVLQVTPGKGVSLAFDDRPRVLKLLSSFLP